MSLGLLLRTRTTPHVNNRFLRPSRLFCSAPDFLTERRERHFPHKRLEEQVYRWWEESGFFRPSPPHLQPQQNRLQEKGGGGGGEEEERLPPFMVLMPPPNVTGKLHMGHAVFAAVQDVICRYQRMRRCGRDTLWLPGTDHAGIATQYVVMREMRSEGVNTDQISREEFDAYAWKYKNEKGGEIYQQLRRLGASADWSKSKFTLDSDMQEAVVEAFDRLYKKKLIYRGKYMVNWSPVLQTAISDLEVEFSEENGFLYCFKYVLADDNGSTDCYIPVSTSRPETIFGDTAVCVHPKDERYSGFIGKRVKVPFSDRTVPVLCDEYVNAEFGTGALKVTPAHDPNDYEIGTRHQLEHICILNLDGTMNAKAGDRYAGLDRFECRRLLWQDMENEGLAIERKSYIQRVPRSQRSGEIIEPMLSEQWFLRTGKMAKKAIQSVKDRHLGILPEKFEKIWYGWLENNHDWCISRQLWWGHRIPIYYVDGDKSKCLVAKSYDDALQKASAMYGKYSTLTQDSDVLDTWFSSALWPFITLGWPFEGRDDKLTSEQQDMKRFYPTSVLETGHDILFFWVARMVMLGIELTNEVPFRTVYLHGLVRDKNHEKMSKTKGNVVDPIDAVETHGSDALRFSLIQGLSPGQDLAFDMENVIAKRNFANKCWNVGKFVEHSTSSSVTHSVQEFKSDLPLPEKYILTRCRQTTQLVTKALDKYSFAEAADLVEHFIWKDFADWFVEIYKTRQGHEREESSRVLAHVWDHCLRLLHPFMPFLTEALWLGNRSESASIMVSRWPREGDTTQYNTSSALGFEILRDLVKSIRAIRSEYGVEANSNISATVNFSRTALEEKGLQFLEFEKEKKALSFLSRVSENKLDLNIVDDIGQHSDEKCVHAIVNKVCEVFVPLDSMIDKQMEENRLTKQMEQVKRDIAILQGRLSNENFMAKASAKVIAQSKESLQENVEVYQKLDIAYKKLNDL